MLTIHHLGFSQSERILWLCEELELPYRLIKYDRHPKTRLAPPEYKALHPMGTSPVITDGDVVMGESGAIIDYIVARYGDGRLTIAPERPEFPDFIYWLHFANGTMMPTELIGLTVNALGADPARMRPLLQRRQAAYDMIEAHLEKSAYFAGDELTTADVAMLFPLTTNRYFVPCDISAYPNLLGYLARVGERPAYRRAMAAGDPDMVPLLR